MNVSVNLPTDLENAVRQRATAVGLDIETYIVNIVKEDMSDFVASQSERELSHEEFRALLDERIQLHGISNGQLDDSRESIYAGRGE